MPPKRSRLLLILVGLYLIQWAYLASVGGASGYWDLRYTTAEKALEKAPPFSPASLQRFREAVVLAERLEPVDGRLARCYHDLGTLLWLSGQPREACVYLGRSREIFSEVDGPESTWVGIVEERLGEIAFFRGHPGEGMERLRRAEGILVRTLGSLDLVTLRVSALVAIHSRDATKAGQVLRDYQMAQVMLDPLNRFQLEQMVYQKPKP